MGSVYAAEHVETAQRVAVKLIRSDALEKNVSLIGRFKREVKAAKTSESPHIAKLVDAGTNPATGAPYMVMEYLVGEDLHQLLIQKGANHFYCGESQIRTALVCLTRTHCMSTHRATPADGNAEPDIQLAFVE